MTSIDELARRAGDDLRSWDPELAEREPSVAIGRIRRRRVAARFAVGGVAAALVLGLGIWQGGTHEPGNVVTRPADQDEPGPTTTRDERNDTPQPSTTAPTESSTATPVPAVPDPTEPTDPTDLAETATMSTCTGHLSDGRTYVVDIPEGWYANEAFENEPACTHFAPAPVEFFDPDEIFGWASNSDVSLTLTGEGLPEGVTWEESIEPHASELSGPIEAEYSTIAGEAAVREDRVDGQTGDGRWVRWTFLLGGDRGSAAAGGESLNGTPYESSVAALDSIVRSIRIEG